MACGGSLSIPETSAPFLPSRGVRLCVFACLMTRTYCKLALHSSHPGTITVNILSISLYLSRHLDTCGYYAYTSGCYVYMDIMYTCGYIVYIWT